MRIHRIVAGAVLICCMFAACRKFEGIRGLTIKPGILSVGMEISYPPLEYYDANGKTPLGFDVDLAQALGRELDVKVVFVDTPFGGVFAGLNTKKFDVAISGITITPERLESYNFTHPYIGNAMTIVALTDAPFVITKPEDIAGKRAACQADTTADAYTASLLKHIDFEVFEYDSVMNCFDDAKLNRVDVVIVDSLVAFEYLERDPDLFKIAYQGKAGEYLGICLKKGDDELTHKLNKALEKIRMTGELTQISQKHFKMNLTPGTSL
ncbi:MAG: ABC transporter substrate-binding protein [Spirochaetaceae bacterium]|nr:ABC transporter substrate-binding protein [Spirochaetaceae bacterium]